MPKNRTQLHVLAYDISMSPTRLTQVHRTVRQWGVPLQYSVFLIPGTPGRISELLAELEGIIDPKLDDIRVYPLPAEVDIVTMGRDVAGLDLFPSGGDPLPPLIV